MKVHGFHLTCLMSEFDGNNCMLPICFHIFLVCVWPMEFMVVNHQLTTK